MSYLAIYIVGILLSMPYFRKEYEVNFEIYTSLKEEERIACIAIEEERDIIGEKYAGISLRDKHNDYFRDIEEIKHKYPIPKYTKPDKDLYKLSTIFWPLSFSGIIINKTTNKSVSFYNWLFEHSSNWDKYLKDWLKK